jgi:hypothetical protein
MADYPPEYRTQPGLPQTPEAFAKQKGLDARGRVRYAAPDKKDQSSKCNALDAKTGSHCDAAARGILGTLQLRRCGKCGGKPPRAKNAKFCPAEHLPRPEKAAPCRNNAGNNCVGKHNGVQMCEGTFCNGTCANLVAEVLWKKEHEGVDYPEGFEWPPKKGAKGKRKRAA